MPPSEINKTISQAVIDRTVAEAKVKHMERERARLLRNEAVRLRQHHTLMEMYARCIEYNRELTVERDNLEARNRVLEAQVLGIQTPELADVAKAIGGEEAAA